MAKVEPGMESMLEMYIFETNTLLEQLDEILLRTEDANVFSQDDINEIFRIMHTIKGSSAMMGFENLQHLAHKGEDMFFVIREKPEIANEELTAAGVYTLHLPTGFFAFDYWVRDSYELTLTYTVTGNSGIESPESDRMRTRGDVYNLLGHKVLTDADMQQIRKLPSGIYIVNGKKVMVR